MNITKINSNYSSNSLNSFTGNKKTNKTKKYIKPLVATSAVAAGVAFAYYSKKSGLLTKIKNSFMSSLKRTVANLNDILNKGDNAAKAEVKEKLEQKTIAVAAATAVGTVAKSLIEVNKSKESSNEDEIQKSSNEDEIQKSSKSGNKYKNITEEINACLLESHKDNGAAREEINKMYKECMTAINEYFAEIDAKQVDLSDVALEDTEETSKDETAASAKDEIQGLDFRFQMEDELKMFQEDRLRFDFSQLEREIRELKKEQDVDIDRAVFLGLCFERTNDSPKEEKIIPTARGYIRVINQDILVNNEMLLQDGTVFEEYEGEKLKKRVIQDAFGKSWEIDDFKNKTIIFRSNITDARTVYDFENNRIYEYLLNTKNYKLTCVAKINCKNKHAYLTPKGLTLGFFGIRNEILGHLKNSISTYYKLKEKHASELN